MMSLVQRKSSLFAWLVCCIIAAGVFFVYLTTSVRIGQGEIVLPLDDNYIHFQYAKQMALGQPYIYNPGDPATSGATSFIYPFILAIGYKLGFQGLNLGLWALVIGACALLASMWLIYLLAQEYDAPRWMSLAGAAIFGLSGAVSWHFMSGMETGLMMTFTLATLFAIVSRRFWGFIICAMLLALTRPEGGAMAIIAVGIYLWQERTRSIMSLQKRRLFGLIMPVLAVGIQPVVNWLVTGSAAASGNQAKSIFGMIPFYWDVVIRRIWDNFVQMWAELVNGTGGRFMPGVIPVLAILGLFFLLIKRERRGIGLLLIGWFLALTAAISTLDTAFWHFKRYQMPLMALLFPLAIWGGAWLWHFDEHAIMRLLTPLVKQRLQDQQGLRIRTRILLPQLIRNVRFTAFIAVGFFLFAGVFLTSVNFLRLYRVNINNVVVQPLAMARWLAANTPEDAVVVVHDVGMMRYMGGRHTIDMVGLTTLGAADAWRNGPGAVAEFLLAHDPTPDYVAAYTTARGLNYLEASVYSRYPLATFPAVYNPADNVALAAEYQGIYRFCCGAEAEEDALTLTPEISRIALSSRDWVTQDERFYLNEVDWLDVADLKSEAAHHYRWSDTEALAGFPTEVYRQAYVNCTIIFEGNCDLVDGGRRINSEESFTMAARVGEDGLLVTRIHPVNSGTFDVYVDDRLVDTQWIPVFAGHWLEIMTLIPAEFITSEAIRLRIVPHVPGGHYMPYYHWLWQGVFDPLDDEHFLSNTGEDIGSPIASYQSGAFNLRVRFADDNVIEIVYETDGTAQDDYKTFVHLYNDINQPPIAQFDSYPGTDSLNDVIGTYPPGNWLPGVIYDRIVVDLSEVPPGRSSVAIGFYEATTFERLMPTLIMDEPQYWVDEAGRRLFIGEIDVP